MSVGLSAGEVSPVNDPSVMERLEAKYIISIYKSTTANIHIIDNEGRRILNMRSNDLLLLCSYASQAITSYATLLYPSRQLNQLMICNGSREVMRRFHRYQSVVSWRGAEAC